MPFLSQSDQIKFEAKKDQIVALWNSAKIDPLSREYPRKPDKTRIDLNEWLESKIWSDMQRSKLVQLKNIFDEFVNDTFNNKAYTANTKTKRITEYRKILAKFLGETYQKGSYNFLPYCLFIIPEGYVAQQNQEYRKEIIARNESENKIIIPASIADKLIAVAVFALRQKTEKQKDLALKGCAYELLTGRRQFEEIYNPNCSIKFKGGMMSCKGLAKKDGDDAKYEFKNLPYLGKDLEAYDGEIGDLLLQTRKELLNFTEETKDKKSSVQARLNRPITMAMMEFERVLLPVRKANPHMPALESKTHTLRKLYAAIALYKFGGDETSTQYIARILCQGKIVSGSFIPDDTTAKSYSQYLVK